MSWPKLEGRFMRWFAEVVSQGDMDLAGRLARITVVIANADLWAPTSLRLLFDEFEAAQSQHPILEPPDPGIPELRGLIEEIEDLLDDASGANTNSEPATAYVVSVAGPRAGSRTGPA